MTFLSDAQCVHVLVKRFKHNNSTPHSLSAQGCYFNGCNRPKFFGGEAGVFGGEAGVFGGEASPPPPPTRLNPDSSDCYHYYYYSSSTAG